MTRSIGCVEESVKQEEGDSASLDKLVLQINRHMGDKTVTPNAVGKSGYARAVLENNDEYFPRKVRRDIAAKAAMIRDHPDLDPRYRYLFDEVISSEEVEIGPQIEPEVDYGL